MTNLSPSRHELTATGGKCSDDQKYEENYDAKENDGRKTSPPTGGNGRGRVGNRGGGNQSSSGRSRGNYRSAVGSTNHSNGGPASTSAKPFRNGGNVDVLASATPVNSN